MANDSPAIGPGAEVLMHFKLSLEDGTVADESEPGEPLRFIMGDGTMIPGLEMILYGLKVGDRENLRIGPQDAFGYADPSNVHSMARSDFGPEFDLQPGLVIAFTTPSGEEVPGIIREVHDDSVQVDFNHPLAGHEVRFEVEILEVRPPATLET